MHEEPHCVFHAEMMGDNMYFHQAIKHPDTREFVKAVVKEVEVNVKNDHWVLVKREEVPPDIDIPPSVWAMRFKRNLMTNKIKGHKAWQAGIRCQLLWNLCLSGDMVCGMICDCPSHLPSMGHATN
jgi:hypothetical protein